MFSLISILPNTLIESLTCGSFVEPDAMVDMLYGYCRQLFDTERAGEGISGDTMVEICRARVRVYMSLLRRLGRLGITI